MCQFDWAPGDQDTWSALLWVCLCGCFWVRLTFKSVDWVKKIALHGVRCMGQSRGDMNQRRGRRGLALSLLDPNALQVGTWAFSGHTLGQEQTPSTLLALRPSECRPGDPMAPISHSPVLHTHLHICTHTYVHIGVCVYISYWFHFSGEHCLILTILYQFYNSMMLC